MSSPAENPAANQPPFDPVAITWAALLGTWVRFARAALVLPDDAAGRRMKDSVGDIIMLQAVWTALQHLDNLHPAEKTLGLDRAAVLIDRHAAALEARYAGEPMPALLRDLIADARNALTKAAGDQPPLEESDP